MVQKNSTSRVSKGSGTNSRSMSRQRQPKNQPSESVAQQWVASSADIEVSPPGQLYLMAGRENLSAKHSVDDRRREVLDFLREMLQLQAEPAFKLFLTIKEAAAYSGLPVAVIRRLVAKEILPAAKAGGWRIKRKYLEQLDLRHIRRLSE